MAEVHVLSTTNDNWPVASLCSEMIETNDHDPGENRTQDAE